MPLTLQAVPETRVADRGPRTTPYLDLDVDAALAAYARLGSVLPSTGIRYAVKANPHPQLLHALAAHGCGFDVASPAEVDAALAAGASCRDLVYSNPVKLRRDIARAADAGVRLFVVDSAQEVGKVADAAPGSSVLCRLVTSGRGSDWPLSRKYGCSTREAVVLLRACADAGLDAAGVSFHVGSQQHDPDAWSSPIAASAQVFAALERTGLRPWLLDLGGGFPAGLEGGHPPVRDYGAAIERRLTEHFGARRPHTLVEPGRGIVGDAGEVVASVVAVVWRGDTRWVYLDVGVFTGLVETLDEAIRYPLRSERDGGPAGPCVLAGPTCDSADVLYEDVPVSLPLALTEGDVLRLSSAGAYTTCYSTVGFNGFAPLPTVLRGT